jgi:D-glycero-alpha-D-manno-heptose-7-phosphate kinase
MSVLATTPCRIDLAGGTLDLEFLYAFLGGSVTVNLAVEIRARAFARRLRPGRVRLASSDLGVEAVGASVDGLALPRRLALHARALSHYGPATGVEVTTEAEAPRGSGLGGSSALLMAISAALLRLQDLRVSKARLVDTGARLEASLLGVPTGKQDYLAALYGGLAAHHFSFDGWCVERLEVSGAFLQELEQSLVLAYTGRSRLSGVPNWEKFKAYVENKGSTRRRFERLKAIASRMREALLAEDLEGVGELLGAEWAARRRLAEGVSSPALEETLRKARRAGALGGKLCGAGGGGCLVLLAAEGRTEALENLLRRTGYRLLPVRVARRGLVVREEAEG